MGTSLGMIHFEDGTLLYAGYQNTSDVMNSILKESIEDYDDVTWGEGRECICGNDEPVQIFTNYGGGFYWKGRACKQCKVLTEGHDPFDPDIEIINGYPEWYPGN